MRIIALSWILLFGSSFTQPIYNAVTAKDESRPLSIVDELWGQLQATEQPFELPSKVVLELGVKGYLHLVASEAIKEGKPLAVIDFSLPSSQKRLWVVDVSNGTLIHHGYVAHGRNSGELMAQRFSNRHSSYMSSLGFYRTAETYYGKHGYSLRLDGLEKGFNDQARDRAVVIHGADYAREDFIKQTGRLGRSLGCPALPTEESNYLIDIVKEGALLFIFAEDEEYLSQSNLLNA